MWANPAQDNSIWANRTKASAALAKFDLGQLLSLKLMKQSVLGHHILSNSATFSRLRPIVLGEIWHIKKVIGVAPLFGSPVFFGPHSLRAPSQDRPSTQTALLPDRPQYLSFFNSPALQFRFFFSREVFSLSCGPGSRPWPTQIARLGSLESFCETLAALRAAGARKK